MLVCLKNMYLVHERSGSLKPHYSTPFNQPFIIRLQCIFINVSGNMMKVNFNHLLFYKTKQKHNWKVKYTT